MDQKFLHVIFEQKKNVEILLINKSNKEHCQRCKGMMVKQIFKGNFYPQETLSHRHFLSFQRKIRYVTFVVVIKATVMHTH